jgi:hypothetical protein
VSLRSQSTFGALVGTVHDSTGAVISKAVVKITNTDEGTARAIATDDQGTYEALNLKPGHYSVTVSVPGFQQETIQDISLAARQTSRVDVTLQVGAVTEAVNVEAQGAGVIASETSTIASSYGSEKILELPTNLRASTSTSPYFILTTAVHMRIAIPPHMPDPLLPPQQSIDRARRNLLQLASCPIATAHLAQLAQALQFAAQHRHHPLSARLFENIPHLHQVRHHRCPVFRSSLPLLSPAASPGVIQNLDQVFPVQAGPLLRLIQQPTATALIDPLVHLPSSSKYCLRVHVHLSEVPCLTPSWVTLSFDPTDFLLVTFR